jgi:hypothetical protein
LPAEPTPARQFGHVMQLWNIIIIHFFKNCLFWRSLNMEIIYVADQFFRLALPLFGCFSFSWTICCNTSRWKEIYTLGLTAELWDLARSCTKGGVTPTPSAPPSPLPHPTYPVIRAWFQINRFQQNVNPDVHSPRGFN